MSGKLPLDCSRTVPVTSVAKQYIWPSLSFWCYQFIIFVENRHISIIITTVWFFLCLHDILPYMDAWTEWRNEWRIRKLTESSNNRLAAAELSINLLAHVMYINIASIFNRFPIHCGLWFMVFNATFIKISVILWLSVLLVEEAWVPRENHRYVASHWQTYHIILYILLFYRYLSLL